MKKKKIELLFLFVAAFLFASCSNDDDANNEIKDPSEVELKLDTPEEDMTSEGELPAEDASFTLKIATAGKWTAKSDQSWCVLSKQEGSGNILINGTIEANDQKESRTATITISLNGKEQTIIISQVGTEGQSQSLTISLDPKDGIIQAEGGAFSLNITASSAWKATADQTWASLSAASGDGNAVITGEIEPNNDVNDRTIKITVSLAGTDKGSKSVTVTQKGREVDTPDPERPQGIAGRIEIPKLKGGNMYQFYSKTTNYNNNPKFLNYSAEYNYAQKQVNWVAFTFDNVSTKKNVKRKDSFKIDEEIPKQYQTVRGDYGSPYNRGHLVASSDRLFSRDANSQTFFYSNMSPQIINFNSGIWNKMEIRVREWADNLSASDTIYVAKGGFIDGTIADGTLIEYTGVNDDVAVPRYYFMAVLSYIKGQYKAMAFWVDQSGDYKRETLSSTAISVEELEQKTRIDFFTNLDKNIQNRVEKKENFKKSDWGL